MITAYRCSAGGSRAMRAALAPLTMLLLALIAPPAAADDAVVAPDPAVQAAIASVAQADNGPQQQAALQHLLALGQAERPEIIRQVAYFASRASGPREAMAAGVVIRRFDVPDEALARALVPCLSASDAALAESVRNILGGIEHRTAGRRPDFSVYLELLADDVRAARPLPEGLIRYLYDADPGMALLTVMRAHQLRDPEEIKPILWAEHVVSDMLWRQQYGFLPPDASDPAALRELAALARHDAWWVRLYVAETMRRHAALRQADLIDRLARDENALVRESGAALGVAP